ncbi:hypothetical protein QJQ45_030184, partial [Haematococcus lacustris]
PGGQRGAPAAATPAAQQQQAVNVSASQQARQQGPLPLPAAQAKSAGALPSQRAGQRPGLMPRPVRRKISSNSEPEDEQQCKGDSGTRASFPGAATHVDKGCGVACEMQAYDLMAIKLRGMHTPLNFVPKTYSDMCELLAQVDQVLLLELLQSFSRTKNKLLVESARQQQRMDWEAAIEASDPTMGTDCEDAAPTATTLSCQPSPPLAPHSADGGGMAMGDDVATRFDAALEAVLRHTSVRVPSNLNRLLLGRQHNGAGGLCGATYDKNKQSWQAKIKHCSRTYHLGSFQCGEHAAKAHDLMAIKCRGMHTPLNFVSKTYNDMYELLAQMEQPLLLKLLRAYACKNKKLLAEAGRQQGSTIQEAALTAPDPAMHPDWSDASSPTATTRPRQAGQPLAPPSAAARAKAKCSIEALGWPCDAAGSDAAAALPPGKRPRRSAMALVGSAPLGSSAQGTSTGRCPSAAAVCADTTASNTVALGLTQPAAPQLVGAPGVSLGVYKGRARPASRGWAEADALWEQAEQVHEGGGGDGKAMLPGSHHATAGQDSDAQENNQVCRLLPNAVSNAWYADSSEWGPKRAEADVAGHALGQDRSSIGWELPPNSLQRSPVPRHLPAPLVAQHPVSDAQNTVSVAACWSHLLPTAVWATRLVSALKELSFMSSSKMQQTSQLLWCFADLARQPENSRAHMTQAQCNAVMALLQRMAGEAGTGKAGDPHALPPLQQFDARRMSMAAWSLGRQGLKRLGSLLPPASWGQELEQFSGPTSGSSSSSSSNRTTAAPAGRMPQLLRSASLSHSSAGAYTTTPLSAMRSLLHALPYSPRPGHSFDCGLRPAARKRSPAPRTCFLPRQTNVPSRTRMAPAHTLRQYDPPPRPKQDLEQLVSAVEELPFLSSSSQVQQTSQLLWCFADWAKQPENSKVRMTQAQCNAVLDLLQHMAGEARPAGTAGKPPALSPLQQFNAQQLNMAAWSLGRLKPHLPAAAVTSARTAIASHSASSEAMKRGNWRDWSNLLYGLAAAGMQCSSSPELTRLCDQAVQLLPERLARGAASQDISMTLWAMAKSGYTGSAQPLLQSVTAAISQGGVMKDAKAQAWTNLIWATSKLPGCREESRLLLGRFMKVKAVVPGLDAQSISNLLYAMGEVLWHDMKFCRQLAERASQKQKNMNGQDISNSLYGLARIGYHDTTVHSLVRRLAAELAKADLTAFKPQELANLVYARSMFLALSIHQAVSSGHSQLASEPQLNSMAAALWRECSRRGQGEELWGEENLAQLYTASQWLHACTGGQISLAASPALQELLAKAETCKKGIITKLQINPTSSCSQPVQALAAAGHDEVQQAVISQDGTHCTQLLVQGPKLTLGISVEESSEFLPKGRISGVVAHVKLQQLTHFDAGVVVNKAAFDRLASDSERAAFMREQVRASLPVAKLWRQLLQAEGGHCAGQVEAPAAATPAAQQQQSGSVSAGQQARQQGALPLPAAQAKSAGALPSQRAGQAPGLMPRTVQRKMQRSSVQGRRKGRVAGTEQERRSKSKPLSRSEQGLGAVRDLMAIKLRGMHTPLNFVPETYSDIYELLAQVDQVLLLELLQSFSRTWKKLLAESAWQQQRMTCEAAIEASDPTMGIDWDDAAPTATTLPCQPSHPLTPHSAAGGGMAMGDDVATRFDAALDELLLHASVRAPSNLQRQKHNDAGDFCGAVWSKANQHWRAQVSHNGRNLYLGCFQHEEHAAKVVAVLVHDLMAIKLRGMHTALNFVPETYSDMYELLAQVDQALLLELLQANSRTRNKLLAELARQQQRMALEAALEASDPTMGTDTEDATPTATTLPCQPSHPLASHSADGGGMAIMGDDVATRFGSALEAVLSHASVHDLMAIKLRGLHTPLNFVSKTYNGMYDLLAQVDQALLVELLLSFSRTRNKLLAESARQQKRITPKAALEASDLTMSTDGEDSSNKVAAMFDPVLEALLHHNSVRSLNRLQPGLRQHKEAGGLCGVFWNKAQQRPWTVGDCRFGHTVAHSLPVHDSRHADKGCGLACDVQVHDLMAIKLRGMHTPLNFVPETYNDMYELLAQVEQPLLLELLRAFNRKNKKLLAESGRQQGCTIQEAGLTARDPAMHPDLSDASSPTATTLPRQAASNTAALGLTLPAAPQLVGAPGVSLGVYKGRARPASRGWAEADALWEQDGEAMLPGSSHATAEQDCDAQEYNQQFSARQLSMAAWSLGKLKPHLPAAAVTSACTALTRNSASSEVMEKGGWRVVAHAKLQQLTRFDAAVVVKKAVFNQLASDSKRAAFMREQVRASLPEAEAWRQLLQEEAGHCAGQVKAPAAATPAAQQQQSVSVSAGQQARQQGALPLPAAQAKSAGALPSQRAGQAPGLMPCPVRRKIPAQDTPCLHLNSMAVALWRVCSRRGQSEEQWRTSQSVAERLHRRPDVGYSFTHDVGSAKYTIAFNTVYIVPKWFAYFIPWHGKTVFAVVLHSIMRPLLPASTCTPQHGYCIGRIERPACILRCPATHTWCTNVPLRTLSSSVQALRQYDSAAQPKQDLEQLVSAVEELPFLSSSSQVEQTSQLLWSFADWAKQAGDSRASMTRAQRNAAVNLLQHLTGESGVGKAGSTPAPLPYFDAYHINMAAWSLGKLRPHLPPGAVSSACTALAHHAASSGFITRCGWREWSNLLHGLATAGMQCSSSPDLTKLCDQAVQLLPEKLTWAPADQAISMTLWAMAKSGYTGSAQPLLQSVTAAISQGGVMRDAKPQAWANLIWASGKLPGCREEARQLLDQFAARSQAVLPGLKDQEVSNIIFSMGLVLWRNKEICRRLAERAAETMQFGNTQHLTNSLYGLARLGYLDSSVRSLAAGVAKADLAAFPPQAITKLLAARSMYLALSIHQAVSSGHSQLASEPQLNSMAAALWRECSKRGQGEGQWGMINLTQLHAASKWLHACTGGQISLAASPALQELLAKAAACQESTIGALQAATRRLDFQQLLQALAAAGYTEVSRAALSQDGTCCTQLLVQGPGLTRGIAVDQSPNFLQDGSMSGAAAYVKLQQLGHFDAGVVVNKAVFDELACDSELAAFMREELRVSLPEAEAWRQLLQADGVRHCAGQGRPPVAATPATRQQQATSMPHKLVNAA